MADLLRNTHNLRKSAAHLPSLTLMNPGRKIKFFPTKNGGNLHWPDTNNKFCNFQVAVRPPLSEKLFPDSRVDKKTAILPSRHVFFSILNLLLTWIYRRYGVKKQKLKS